MKLILTGSSNELSEEWKKSQDQGTGSYANVESLAKPIPPQAEGLFSTQEVKEVDPSPSWRANQTDLQRGSGVLPELANLAHELGYGVGAEGEGILLPVGVPPAREAEPPNAKAKQLHGRERIRQIFNQNQSQRKGSSLDPTFRRPKLSLKRKRERSSDSSSSRRARGFRSRRSLSGGGPGEAHSSEMPWIVGKVCTEGGWQATIDGSGEGRSRGRPQSSFCEILSPGLCPFGSISSHETRVPHSCHVFGLYHKGKHVEMPRGRSAVLESRRADQPVGHAVIGESLGIHSSPEISALACSEESRTTETEHWREEKVRATWKGQGSWTKGNWENAQKGSWENQIPKGWDKRERAERERNTKGNLGGPWQGRRGRDLGLLLRRWLQLHPQICRDFETLDPSKHWSTADVFPLPLLPGDARPFVGRGLCKSHSTIFAGDFTVLFRGNVQTL